MESRVFETDVIAWPTTGQRHFNVSLSSQIFDASSISLIAELRFRLFHKFSGSDCKEYAMDPPKKKKKNQKNIYIRI